MPLRSFFNNLYIFGTSDHDELTGTGSGNWMFGQDGDDTLDGAAGNDHVWGGRGNDTLILGLGADWLFGQKDDDTFLVTDTEFDGTYIDGGDGLDVLNFRDIDHAFHVDLGAGTFEDLVSGSSGTIANVEDVAGSERADMLIGDGAANKLSGNSGDDFLDGAGGDDRIYAEGGRDTVHGGEGDDFLAGNGDDDLLYGDAGDDDLRGGHDSDTLRGGEGNDRLEGGRDSDVFVFSADDVQNMDGTDTITDFDPDDNERIVLEGFTAPDLTVHDDGDGNALLVLASGSHMQSIIVSGIAPADFDSAWIDIA